MYAAQHTTTALPQQAIKFDQLNLALGSKCILDNVSAHFNSGELTVLLGPNGTGKSSLLKVLTREFKQTGSVQFFGKAVSDWKPSQLAKHLGVVPQSSSLTFNFTVKEVVELGGIPLDASAREIEQWARDAMVEADILHLASRAYPSLSGGEKQRVHLARVLTQLSQSGQNKILLLDEPTSALDLSHQHQTLILAKKLVTKGASVVIVMHDLNLAAQYADRVLILNQGQIAADGTPWEVLTADNIQSIYHWKTQVIAHPSDQYPVIINSSMN